jgi:hypothetical protein
LRLGISTASQPVDVVQDLLQRGLIDFVELGIGSAEKAEEVIGAVRRSAIETLHGMPFLSDADKGYMFNPCYRPLEAADVLERTVKRASRLGLKYRLFGVHAGLLGEIAGPDDFTLKDHIGVEEGFDNLEAFRDRVRELKGITLEVIYGWDEPSRAIGMTQGEIERIGGLFPLLIDIGHIAINFELFGGGSLDAFRTDGLSVAEVHISFLDLSASPPWDHRGFARSDTNLRILSKLDEFLDTSPRTPVVLEIAGDPRAIEDTLGIVRSRVG